MPDYRRQPVPAGEHAFVLAVSGAADSFGGWARALHKEAGLADGVVRVLSGHTTVVELVLELRGPRIVSPCACHEPLR